ncbi:MAG: alpha/beta hydrolase [Gammaproteobacteria bacterium]|nr:alpha/beta hydrolase [Gammaproteobacteria bacterium]
MDQPIASQQLQTVVAHLREIAQEALTTAGDLEAKRRLVDRYFAAHPDCIAFTGRAEPAGIPGIPAQWLTAPGSEPSRRMLYLHGGSWMAGRVSTYLPHIGRIAEASHSIVLAVDYRLAPENPFPAGLDDCVESFLWMLEHGPAGAGAARQCFIAGDSAGGNLALATLLALRQRGARLPDGAIALSPATDLTWQGESMTSRALADPALNAVLMPMITDVYLQGRDVPTNPLVSPLFGDLRGLPPLLLQAGDAEILLSDATRFAELARAAGVEANLEVYPHMPHVFQGFAPFLPEAVQAIARIGGFVT